MTFKKHFNINTGRKLPGIEMFDNFESVNSTISTSIPVSVQQPVWSWFGTFLQTPHQHSYHTLDTEKFKIISQTTVNDNEHSDQNIQTTELY